MSQTFHALGVSPAVERELAAREILAPFPIQSLVVPDAIAGNDVLAKSPTASKNEEKESPIDARSTAIQATARRG